MRGTLIFDGDCGFCTRSRDFLDKIDNEGRITLLPLQRRDAVLVSGRSVEQLSRSVVWVDESGAVFEGAEAVNAAVSAAIGIPLALQVYRKVPGMRAVQEWVYRKVADNRARFPGKTPWCQSNPGDCERVPH